MNQIGISLTQSDCLAILLAPYNKNYPDILLLQPELSEIYAVLHHPSRLTAPGTAD